MRIFSLNKTAVFAVCFAFFVTWGCDEKVSDEVTIEKTDTIPVQLKETTPSNKTSPTEDFPILNNENAVPFLRNYFKDNPERKLQLTTRLGTLKIRLYDETPLHTANFLMLVKRDYFDNTEFTRVVENFVVQGGNNDKESEELKRLLIGNYLIPPEMSEKLFHKKGALAMARNYEDNPEKLSSAYNFYFVHGQKFNEPQLLGMERDHEMTISDEKRSVYKTIGGAPHLDGEHTVFGEIYEGLDVLDKMAAVETDKSDWPIIPLVMEISVLDE
ncbi:MAG TPA: peptidylprolyl isomerase [Cryomorphaceae bacterium]|nr:peptidylprolyl isomerase [Cryomorphaceae bacterium]